MGGILHRMRKRRCPRHIAIPELRKRTMIEISSSWELIEPQDEILYHAPIVNFNRNDNFLGIFGRGLQSGPLRCYQYLWVWDRQIFPPHAMDYAPAFVMTGFGSNLPNVVFYDRFHYRKRTHSIVEGRRPTFRLNPLWNSFAMPHYPEQEPTSEKIEPLYDDYLHRWWWEEPHSDGVMSDWYGREEDYTPHLKIYEQVRNPFGVIHPGIGSFDESSPRMTGFLEDTSAYVAKHFAFVALYTKNLHDLLDHLKYKVLYLFDEHKCCFEQQDEYKILVASGYVSFLLVLHNQDLIDLPNMDQNQLLSTFFKFRNKSAPIDKEDLLSMLPKSIFKPTEIEGLVWNVDDSSEYRIRYYKDIEDAIKSDKPYNVLRDTMIDWYHNEIAINTSLEYQDMVHQILIGKDIVSDSDIQSPDAPWWGRRDIQYDV
ncbi:MAG: hypothetical protein ACXAEF_02685 [Candidatus Thorarchaeota archaeon]|jgi:hypothetical protein